MVCLSWHGAPAVAGYTLSLREVGLALLRRWLADPDVTLVLHNAPYDLGVACAEDPSLIPLVFAAYRAGRIECMLIIQMLLDVALGQREWRRFTDPQTGAQRVARATYGLDDLAQFHFNEHLEKADTWRLRYALLDGVPVDQWPEEARSYAIQDSVWAIRVREAQSRVMLERFGGEIPNQAEQQRAGWALHLMSMWGIRADRAAVEKFVEHCEEEIGKLHDALIEVCVRCDAHRRDHARADHPFENSNIFKVSPRGVKSRTMAEIRRRVVASLERLQVDVPYTDPSPRFPDGQVVTDKDTLQMTDDPALLLLAEGMSWDKQLKQWEGPLRAAVERPVCCRYTVIVRTGRTSCSGSEGQEGSNIQNPPRKGDVRPCIVARPGCVLGSTDADTIELRAHAQDCLEIPEVGYSRLAEMLVEQHQSGGPDAHEVLAANLLDLDARELQARVREGDGDCIDARQFSKIPNYGFPGGLGAPTFVGYAAGQLDRDQFQKWFSLNREEAEKKARRYRDVWFETYPENRAYFRFISDLIEREGEHGEVTVRQLMSGRIRGGTRFTAAANGFFQGRVADAMKEVLFRLAHECYVGECSSCWGSGCGDCGGTGKSILWGSRPIMFLHDEPILEHPEATASERVERQRTVMEQALNRWMPDVPCTSGASLSRRWYKGAKGLIVDGRMVPVKPVKRTGANGKVKVEWVPDLIAA